MSTQKKLDLLVIGELNMDMILDKVESFPELGKEKIVSDFNLTLGSSSAIFASNIARLGVKTGFCGMVGQDDFGRTIIRKLKKNSIGTSLVKTSADHQTGLTAIIRYGDDRAMVTYPGAMEHFSLQNIPEKAFKQARHLHISSIFLQPGIKNNLFQIIEKATSAGMTISLDSQWDPSEKWDLDIQKLITEIDFFLPNEVEFLNLTASSTVEEGLKKLNPNDGTCTIIVKRGLEGATFTSDGTMETASAYINNEVVDTIGAGDSFNAGFIYRFLKGDPLKQCVKFGNITGAVSTTEAGGTKAISSLDQVLKIAKNNFSITNIDDFTR